MRRTGTGAGSGADPELEAPATFWGESGGVDVPVLWALACERRDRERIRSWKLRPHSGENLGGVDVPVLWALACERHAPALKAAAALPHSIEHVERL